MGIEAVWKGRDFPHPSRLAFGPAQPPVQWYRASDLGVKWPGAWYWPLTPISTKFKKERRVVPILPLIVFMACSWLNFVFYPYLYQQNIQYVGGLLYEYGVYYFKLGHILFHKERFWISHASHKNHGEGHTWNMYMNRIMQSTGSHYSKSVGS